MRGVTNPEEAAAAVRGFVARPDERGLLLFVRDPGVDLAVNVVAERQGAYVWTCAQCQHLARHGNLPRGPVICPLCGAPGPGEFQFRGACEFRTYAWVLRWARPGMEGVGLGPVIDSGRFSDAWLLAGVRRIQDCLTADVAAMERQNVTSVRDLHWIRAAEAQETRDSLNRGMHF